MYVGSVSGVCVYMVCVPLRDVFVCVCVNGICDVYVCVVCVMYGVNGLCLCDVSVCIL